MIPNRRVLAEKLAIVILILVLVAVLLFWNKQEYGSYQLTLDFLIYAGIFAILAISLNLESGYTGLNNFGVVAFFAVGAYASLLFTLGYPILGHNSDSALLSPFYLSLIVGIGAGAVAGYLVSLTTLNLREDYLAIVTIALGEIMRIAFLHEDWIAPLGKTKSQGGFKGVGMENPFISGFDIFKFQLFGLKIESGIEFPGVGPREEFMGFRIFMVLNLLLVWGFVVLTLIFSQALVNSPFGRVMKGVREDEIASKSLGKNAFRIKTQVFVVGSGIAGLAGGLYGYYIGFISPDSFLPTFTFTIWIMMIIGGKANNYSVVLGATLMTFLERGVRLLKDLKGTVFPELDPLYRFRIRSDEVILILPADFLVLLTVVGFIGLGSFALYEYIKKKEDELREKSYLWLYLSGLLYGIAALAVILQMRFGLQITFGNFKDVATPLYAFLLLISGLVLSIGYIGGLQRLEKRFPQAPAYLRIVCILPFLLFLLLIILPVLDPNNSASELSWDLEVFNSDQRAIYIALIVSGGALVFAIAFYLGLKRKSPAIYEQWKTVLFALLGFSAVWLAVCLALMLPIDPDNFRLILTGGLLIVFVMFRPEGLIPEQPLTVPHEGGSVKA
ncbi:MAG: branched-chain amino acid ABC transporter permease [Candidatus Hodarchaeales archaeon]|jgi:branched-chain amino acid transport system permease protein